jgi:hypothetical protein
MQRAGLGEPAGTVRVEQDAERLDDLLGSKRALRPDPGAAR